MDEHEVRLALRRVGLAPSQVTAIPGGWANWTFDLDGRQIVRFPKRDSVALATCRELDLLPELGRAVPFAVPLPTHVATWRDRPFFAYPRLAGRALSGGDRARGDELATALGRVLADLHAFPVGRAAALLHLGAPERAWADRYEDLWPTVRDVALPELEDALREDVGRAYCAFVEDPPRTPACLVHNDLGPEHVLLDDGGRPHALIDFEDASVGDPAVDLVALVALLGPGSLPALLAGRDLGERLAERLWFYRWMGGVHAIVHGVSTGDEAVRLDGIDQLRRRFTSRPGPAPATPAARRASRPRAAGRPRRPPRGRRRG